MLRTVFRRPSPAAVLALLVLVVIAAPLANAAEEAVKGSDARSAAEKKKKSKTVERARFADKAKFADNAGKVRGYSVGFAALPSRVVLTGKDGKLPKEIIPAGTQGPQGPPGQTGPAGGFSKTRIVFQQGDPGLQGAASAIAACASDERIAGGGHEIVYPVRTSGGVGPVEITGSKPVVINAAAGTSGWRIDAVRIPNQFEVVGGVVVADTNPDKLVVVKAWAVCVSR